MINYKKIVLVCLASIMMIALGGCAQEREVPELIEPLADNKTFRPVIRGDVGTIEYEVGVVTPVEYCQYFKTANTLRNIKVRVGDYVNEGDILAEADVQVMKKRQQELALEAELINSKLVMEEMYQPLQQEIIDYQYKNQDIIKDGKQREEFISSVGADTENQRFEKEEYSFRLSNIQKEIDDLEKDISDGTIKATKSGYVTYVKSMAKSSEVEAYEAVVVIADYDDTFIQLPGETTQTDKYKKHEYKFALIDGREIPIEEIEYSVSEQVYARSMSKYPNIRYRLCEDYETEIGQNVVLGFSVNRKKDVLTVENDSVYTDEEGTYVYVSDDEGNLVRKVVELGAADEFCKEVISGLDEGELVYCVQTAPIPSNYDEYVVDTGDYVLSEEVSYWKHGDVSSMAYTTPVGGLVTELNVSVGNAVKAGDLLMVIDAEGGFTRISELEMQGKHLVLDYQKDQKDTDKEIDDIRKEYNAMVPTDVSVNALPADNRNMIKNSEVIADRQTQILIQKKDIRKKQFDYDLYMNQLEIEEHRETVDDDGKIRIIAAEDGVVSNINVELGQEIYVNNSKALLLSCEIQADDVIEVFPARHTEWLGLGVPFTISLNYGKNKYSATGLTAPNGEKSYVFTVDDKVVASSCNHDELYKETIFARVDEKLWENENALSGNVSIESLRLENMLVFPGEYLYSEESESANEKCYFVYKLVGDKLVKQYIRKASDYSFGDDNHVVVLTGLSKGDVIVKDKTK